MGSLYLHVPVGVFTDMYGGILSRAGGRPHSNFLCTQTDFVKRNFELKEFLSTSNSVLKLL